MRWNYTKTMLILAVAGSAIRTAAPLLVGHDPFGPEAIGGGPLFGVLLIVLLGPFFVLADVIAYYRARRREGRNLRAS